MVYHVSIHLPFASTKRLLTATDLLELVGIHELFYTYRVALQVHYTYKIINVLGNHENTHWILRSYDILVTLSQQVEVQIIPF